MISIRLATDADSDAVAGLIREIFGEFDGVVFDLAELPELRAVQTSFEAKQGRFWVAVDDGTLVGCVGLSPRAGEACELHKLYVARTHRRGGLGGRLCTLVEDETRARGAARVELWSDAKFVEAHRFYERRGYVRDGRCRALHDRSDTVEHHYERSMT